MSNNSWSQMSRQCSEAASEARWILGMVNRQFRWRVADHIQGIC